jgi:hypothetical protein
MDYLDPNKKRKHKTQLLVGYGLFAIAIGFATLLLVYMANGYDVERGTGRVIQNGLIYLDSRPGGATVTLNGERQKGTTDARLVLPEGEYDIELDRAGYRKWSRNLILEGGSLRRLTYPRLIPEELATTVGAILRADPVFASQSIDKKWLVLSYADNPLQMDIIDTEAAAVSPATIVVPAQLVDAPVNGTIEVVEWADDNKAFLAKYTSPSGVSYLLIDRESPADSQNLTRIFAEPGLEIGFQDRKRDRFFVYQPGTGSLSTATVSEGINPTPFVVGAQNYKTFGRDWVLYITESGEEGLVEARFKRGDKDVLIKKIKTSDTYLLQLAKLGSAPVMGVSSVAEGRAIIYNDPEKYLNDNPAASMPIATTVLRVKDPIDLRISSDSSVIIAYGPENFASHEFEADRSYTFKATIAVDITQELRWLDGQHFLFSSEGKQVMMDFDGSNMFELTRSVPLLGSFYTNDLDLMYSFAPAAAADGETPATPATVSVTNLLIPSDR